MSRGLGKIQQFVLDTLNSQVIGPYTTTLKEFTDHTGKHHEEVVMPMFTTGIMTTWELTQRWVAHRDGISYWQKAQPTENDRHAVERAARKLYEKELITMYMKKDKRTAWLDTPQGRRWSKNMTPQERNTIKNRL